MKKSNTNSKKEIIVVGDRVLIQPDENKMKTSHGLYLPQGVEEKEKVQSGYIVKIGPGYPLPDPNASSEEPWSKSQSEIKYMALQAEIGDYVIFCENPVLKLNLRVKNLSSSLIIPFY